jgi:hypothetical protein
MPYKVVKIVDEYLIVVNYGKIHNANPGDILEVYEIGEKVTDPDTFEDLGTLDIVKGEIKVKNVYQKMSLCISNEYTNNFLGYSLSSISQAITNTEITALNVNTKEITGGYGEKEKSQISLRDPVKIIKSKYKEDELEEIEASGSNED